jgi:photosystem II stability/assembly factor-like uncharacterized protein
MPRPPFSRSELQRQAADAMDRRWAAGPWSDKRPSTAFLHYCRVGRWMFDGAGRSTFQLLIGRSLRGAGSWATNKMTDARRVRAVAVVGIVTLVLVVTAAGYLRLGPFRQSPSQSRTTALPLPSFATAQLKDFQSVSADAAWAFMTTLDGAPLLYASLDAGRSWQAIAVPQAGVDQKFGFQLIDRTTGILQLGHGLMSTVNAGRTWQGVSLPPGQSFGLGAHFLTANKGWYQDLEAYPNQAAQPSSMWWTTNGGASWSQLWQVNADHPSAGPIPLDGTKFVFGFDGSMGLLAIRQGDSEYLVETFDGGRTWSETTLPLAGPILVFDLRLLPDGSAILIARSNGSWRAIKSKDGGRTWVDSRQVPINSASGVGLYDRPALLDYRHWVFANGTVLRSTTDGGQSWSDVHSHLPSGISALHDLWLFPGGKGWATSTDASGGYHVLTTSDGGSTWALSPMPHLESSS